MVNEAQTTVRLLENRTTIAAGRLPAKDRSRTRPIKYNACQPAFAITHARIIADTILVI